MRRVGPLVFAVLAVATVAAFFVTQHLKVADPLYNGLPRPNPSAIAPGGGGCGGQYRVARLSFYNQLRSDRDAVSIVDSRGTVVRTLSRGRYMRKGIRSSFPWDGRTAGGQVAPDGQYYWRVQFLGQGRTVELPRAVTVDDTPPHPRVTSVTPRTTSAPGTVMIRFTGNEGHVVRVDIYRLTSSGGAREAGGFRSDASGQARWDGRLGPRPAPPATYLVGLTVADRLCNTGRFPATLPRAGEPDSGSLSPAEVTVAPRP